MVIRAWKDEQIGDLTPTAKAKIRDAVSGRSVSQLIKDNFFANEMPLPKRSDYFDGVLCQCCGKPGDVDLDAAKDTYKKACDKRREHERLQTKRFKYACFYELGLEEMWFSAPAKVAWEIAWDDGHSAGIYEVYNQFTNLSRILNVM
jgi:hypothetical protein